jgi:hypothetical protein
VNRSAGASLVTVSQLAGQTRPSRNERAADTSTITQGTERTLHHPGQQPRMWQSTRVLAATSMPGAVADRAAKQVHTLIACDRSSFGHDLQWEAAWMPQIERGYPARGPMPSGGGAAALARQPAPSSRETVPESDDARRSRVDPDRQ